MSNAKRLQQRNNLLLLVAILVLIKFVGQPWYQHQQAAREQVDLLNMQLSRALRVMDLPAEINSQQQQLAELRIATEAKLITYRNDAEFRLRAQQALEGVFAGQQVAIDVYEWLTAQPVADGYLRAYRARLTVEGPLKQTMQALLQAQQQLYGVKVLETQFFPEQAGIDYSGRLVVTLELTAVNQSGVIND
jgi:hypothetical protein